MKFIAACRRRHVRLYPVKGRDRRCAVHRQVPHLHVAAPHVGRHPREYGPDRRGRSDRRNDRRHRILSGVRAPHAATGSEIRIRRVRMDIELNHEQRMLLDTVRSFMERELYPHEDMVDRCARVPPELGRQVEERAIESGLYAANLPESVGGGRSELQEHGHRRARVRQDQPCPACVDRTPDRDPARVRGRSERAVSAALRARREPRAIALRTDSPSARWTGSSRSSWAACSRRWPGNRSRARSRSP